MENYLVTIQWTEKRFEPSRKLAKRIHFTGFSELPEAIKEAEEFISSLKKESFGELQKSRKGNWVNFKDRVTLQFGEKFKEVELDGEAQVINLKKGRGVCPHCGSDDISYREMELDWDDDLNYEVYCHSCETCYREIFHTQYVGTVIDLVEGEEP